VPGLKVSQTIAKIVCELVIKAVFLSGFAVASAKENKHALNNTV